jgi:hypothetical protein
MMAPTGIFDLATEGDCPRGLDQTMKGQAARSCLPFQKNRPMMNKNPRVPEYYYSPISYIIDIHARKSCAHFFAHDLRGGEMAGARRGTSRGDANSRGNEKRMITGRCGPDPVVYC